MEFILEALHIQVSASREEVQIEGSVPALVPQEEDLVTIGRTWGSLLFDAKPSPDELAWVRTESIAQLTRVRHMISGPTPLHDNESTSPGTGKNLLDPEADVSNIVGGHLGRSGRTGGQLAEIEV